MSSEEKLDETAIRAQVDAALNQMRVAEPTPAAESATDADENGGSDDPRLHKGRIVSVLANEVHVELGPRTQGMISLEEFEEAPSPGQEYEFSLVSIQDGLWTLSRREARTLATWRDMEKGRAVKATVIGENSGGLELKIGPVSAFMPASEISTHRVEDFTQFVGQTWVCEVVEVNRRKKRIVLSRRAILMTEKREARERTLQTLSPGQVVRGKVEKLEPFGAFVDIGGGVTGLLHVSNISHQRVEDPATVLQVGQDVEVQILEVKNGGKRIGLGMKQLAADPWDAFKSKVRAGQVIRGKVVRVAEFGAFVEVEPAIEGLLHKSQLSSERVNRVEDAVKVGAEVTVRVVSIDPAARRLSLSRLTERGAMIGSEEDVGGEDVDKYLVSGAAPTSGTNLGALLREALAKKEGKSR